MAQVNYFLRIFLFFVLLEMPVTQQRENDFPTRNFKREQTMDYPLAKAPLGLVTQSSSPTFKGEEDLRGAKSGSS